MADGSCTQTFCGGGGAGAGDGALRRFAAIDIGTVTSRLMVADTDGVQVCVVAREYEVTNLGQGVDATGRLRADALARVAAAVDCFLQVRDACSTPACPVVETAVVATSAARDAENAAEFEALLAERGLALQVISGQQEAALTFRGATAGMALGTSVAVVDVGGGSTEVSFGRAGGVPEYAHSFDIGCRRMTERFFHTNPPSADEQAAACAWAAGQFAAWRDTLPADAVAVAGAGCTLVAVAGTATSAISMQREMRVYDANVVHGSRMQRSELVALAARLAAMTEAQREQVVGLDPRRAPVIVAGLLILLQVMDVFGLPEFVASESDILQGMILSLVTPF